MDYKKKYLKYKSKYLKIKNNLTGGMDMGDFNEEDNSEKEKKTSKLLNPWVNHLYKTLKNQTNH